MAYSKGSKSSSIIWEYFVYSSTLDGVVCKICDRTVSTGSATTKRRNTTNLWSHLRAHHGESHEAAKQKSEAKRNETISAQPTIQFMFDRQKCWKNSDIRSKEMDRLIMEMIATDNEPFAMVERVGFKRVMAKAEPRYVLKSEKYYRTEKFDEVYSAVVAKVKVILAPGNAGNALSFTTDCWSGTTESLMSLTCHFIDKNWTRRQIVLNTKPMDGSHTGEYLRDTFLGMLDEWNITKDRVVLVLRDGGANIVKGMRLAELPDLSCTAHTLQLVVRDGLQSHNSIADVLTILKKCATYFHHSILAKQRLRLIQRDLGLPEHGMIQSVSTRWNSTLHMLQRMMEQRRALSLYCGEYGGFTMPTAHQWDLVSSLIEILVPIEEVTLQVSHSDSSASCIIPCIAVLEVLLQDEADTTSIIGSLRQVMIKSMDRRFSKLKDTKFVVLSCLLDPRYKCQVLSSEQLTKAKSWLKEEDAAPTLISEREESVEESVMPDRATTSANMPGENDESSSKKQRFEPFERIQSRNRINEVFKSLLAPQASDLLASSMSVEDELHWYLKEPVIDRESGDALQWWRQNEMRFTRLAKHARRFLCAPPSSVPSERVFSEVSAIYDSGRNRLMGENADKLCFLNYNLKLLDWDY